MGYRFMRFPEGKTKAVTFSYDDGCRQDLRTVDIFNQYGMKGTFNINSAFLGKENGVGKLTAEEIKSHIINNGHEVAVHGEFHKAPGLVRPIDGIKDVLNCRLTLEQEFNCIIRGMAYPDSGIRRFINQASYEGVRKYLEDLDIVYCRTLSGDNNGFEIPTDWHQWMPTAHHNNPQILEWAKEFAEMNIDSKYCAARYPRLFYVWGHSYEFDGKNNWEHLINICEILGRKTDIWYATNMEIYEYVKAYEALVFSADGTRVYNPSLQTVWFNENGTLHCVEPGKVISVQEGAKNDF